MTFNSRLLSIHMALLALSLLFFSQSFAQTFDDKKYIIQREDSLAQVSTPPPHHGEGSSVGYHFFKDVGDFKNVFKKRVLKPGSSMGYHQQKEDEIYYVLSGVAEMKLNEKTYKVKSGDAILTRTGSSHGIRNLSDREDLVLFIIYDKK